MADAKLIIKPPHMLVRLKPGVFPDLTRMHQTIKDAGYQPIVDRTELRVTGKVVKQGDGLAIELDKMATPRTLLVTAAKDDPETAAHLARHLGETVEVDGTWLLSADGKGPGSLAITAIYGADDTKPKN